MPDLDYDFYVQRAEAAKAMADRASDPSVRAIHERMAADYAELARFTAGPALTVVNDDNAQQLSERSASRS